jgi:opacity protein-like surface antigen
MRLPLPVLLACAALAGCAAPAVSPAFEEGPEGSSFAREGVYVEGAAMRSYEHFHVPDRDVRSGNSDLGFAARLGYRASDRFAVEVSGEDTRRFRVAEGSDEAELDLWSAAVQGKLFLLTERFQPYLLAGAGWAHADVRRIDLEGAGPFARAGAGADLYLTESIALFAEAHYDRLGGAAGDLDHVDALAGILIRF